MKNLMLFVHPSKDFIPEHKTSVKIEIDNNLDLGWKREDIVLCTNFPYEYNGVKSVLVNSDNYDANISPCAPIVNVIVELFGRNLIQKNELYWYHDTDLYQTYEITESELNLGKADIGLIEWDNGQKISASSFFFKSSAKDILGWIQEVMYKYRVDEEVAMSAIYTNNLLWATESRDVHEKFVPLNHPGTKNVNERVKKLNITYDFEVGYLNQHYDQATKPIRTAHFHYTRDHLLDSAMYGKNNMNKPLMPERLIKIFHKHGVKGTYLKKMKNLMICLDSKKTDLLKKQIDNSLKLGWKNQDIVLITNFPYEYKEIKSRVIEGVNKTGVISDLLSQEVIENGELWWYHDLDVFQLELMDSSQIDLKDTFAGFTKNAANEFDLGSIFFRKESDKVFGWTSNRARKFNGNEEAALGSLASENYRNINSKYVILNLKPTLIGR